MAFGIKFRLEFTDRKGFDWRADILEDGYVGAVTDLRAGSNNPLSIKFRASSVKLKYAPICSRDAELTVISDIDYQLMELNYNSDKQYKIIIRRDNLINFEGYILKGLGGEQYTSPPYTVKIKATDWTVALKNLKYSYTGANVVRGSDVLINIINNDIGLPKDFLDNSSIYPTGVASGIDTTSLNATYVNQALFVQEGMTSYDVLKDLMTTHYCRFFQKDSYWVVDSIEAHESGTDIVYNVRDTTDYSFVANLTITQPSFIHANLIPIGGASISFIEAPREINVNTDLVLHENILENDGLDNWGVRVNWTELGGGNMIEGTNGTTGHPNTNQWNSQTVKGNDVLGIGTTDSMGGFYDLSTYSEKHTIQEITDDGSKKYTLKFNQTGFDTLTASWAIGDKLLIEDAGVFEVTIGASVGAAGSATIQIRVNDIGILPEKGQRIIGNINRCWALEQYLKIPSTLIQKSLSKDLNKSIQIDIEYATQWYVDDFLGFLPDKGLHFIGIKAGPIVGNTTNGSVWFPPASNGIDTAYTQLIQFEETDHEVFRKFSTNIPLDWDLSGDRELSIALITSYAKKLLYKSIKVTIVDSVQKTRQIINVADNSTNITLSGTLFKAQTDDENSEFAAMGGLLNSNGDEYFTFAPSNLDKNVLLANKLQTQYADNVQVWKGVLEGLLDGSEILRDTKNFNRTFQIQEVTNNTNNATSNVTAVEIIPEGLVPPIYIITADPLSLSFASQTQFEESYNIIKITNNGNVGMTIHCEPSSYFECSNDTFIPANTNHDFIITAPTGGIPSTIYNETVTFQDTASKSNIIVVPLDITILSESATFTVTDGDANKTVEISERYDFDSPSLGTSIEQIINIHSSLISVDVLFFGSNVTASPDPVINIPIAGSSNTTFQSTSNKITTVIGTNVPINWKDTISIPQYILTGWNANYKIKGLARMTIYNPTSIVVLSNRIKTNINPVWVNLPSGTIDFNLNEIITWEVTIDSSPPNTLGETLQMEVYNRSGGARFKDDTVVVGIGTTTKTIVFTATSLATLGYNEGSIDLRLFKI